MHIFLTGEIQIGKSTVITKTLKLLNIKFGGFCTYFGADRTNSNRCLYICDASQSYSYDEQHVIARFQAAAPPEVYPECFDDLGAGYVSAARKSSKLIVMDECGNFENTARVFQKEILSALDDNIPVLGVVKKSSAGWTDKIRNHSNVKLITVTVENREALPALLAETVKSDLGL